MNLLCRSLSPPIFLAVDEGESGGKKHKQKENRLCSSIFPQPPDNSTAIDNQSLISLISLTFSLSLSRSVLSFLSSPSVPPAKVLKLLRRHAQGHANAHKWSFMHTYTCTSKDRSSYLCQAIKYWQLDTLHTCKYTNFILNHELTVDYSFLCMLMEGCRLRFL